MISLASKKEKKILSLSIHCTTRVDAALSLQFFLVLFLSDKAILWLKEIWRQKLVGKLNIIHKTISTKKNVLSFKLQIYK